MSLSVSRSLCLSSSKLQPERKLSQKSPPGLPWKVKLADLTLSFSMTITRNPDGSVNRQLMNLFDSKNPPSSKPINGVKTTDITVDETRNLWFRLYTPTTTTGGEAGLPIIFFFHGGGFAFMSANSKLYDEVCKRFAREFDAVIISVNYRNSPEYRYPCQSEDCLDVLTFVDNKKVQGLSSYANLKHCFLAGDSAGANLVHDVALKAGGYEFSNIELSGTVSIQPCFGGEERTESEIRLSGAPFVTLDIMDWLWRAYLPEGSDRNHPASNVFSFGISEVKFPATMVFVGGFDPLQEWQRRYHEWLKRNGKEAFLVEYPNAIHLFYAFPELPESSLFIKEVKDFMQKQISKQLKK